MEIKTELVVSLVNSNGSVLMSAVLFMSATSITRSSRGVLCCSTQLWVVASDDVVSHMIINSDTCLLSISGTCRAGGKDGAPDNYLLS